MAVLSCVSTGTYKPEGVTPTRALNRTSDAVRVQLAVNVDFIFFFVKRKWNVNSLLYGVSMKSIQGLVKVGFVVLSFQLEL